MSNASLSSYVGKLLLSDLSSFADHIYSMDEDLHALNNHSTMIGCAMLMMYLVK